VRRRLLVSTLVVAVVSVILLGIPLGIVTTKLIRDEAQKRINREATQIAAALDSSPSTAPSGTSVDASPSATAATMGILRQFAGDDRYVSVNQAGQTIATGTPITGSVDKGTAVGSKDEAVTVVASASSTNSELASVWLGVAALAIVSLAAAVELARRQAKRLGGPLEDLAVGAERLGAGDPRPRNHRYGVPELDKVAQVLDRSAERIGRLLGAERALAADASHQLRSPLTALSIRLEEIVATSTEPAVREEASAALVQAERLAAVVDSLLAEHSRSARSESGVVVAIDAVLAQQSVEWDPAFRRARRRLVRDGSTGLKVVSTPGGLAQVVATLIDNALVHGAGTVTVHTREASGHIVVEVRDEGPGVADDLVQRCAPHRTRARARPRLGSSGRREAGARAATTADLRDLPRARQCGRYRERDGLDASRLRRRRPMPLLRSATVPVPRGTPSADRTRTGKAFRGSCR
jgi:signal transduction histidine kinase